MRDYLNERALPFDTLQLLLVMTSSTFLIWLCSFHWNRRRLYKMAAKIPGPEGYPIIGLGFKFLGNYKSFLKVFIDLFDTNPDIFKFWLGPKLVIGLCNPEHLQITLNHSGCLEKDPLYRILKLLMGNGLITAPVHSWRKNRKIINPSFNMRILNSMVPIFNEQSKIFVEVLKKEVGNKDLDIVERLFALSLDTFCETSMGIKMNSQTTYNYYGDLLNRAAALATTRCFNSFYHYDIIWNLKYRKAQEEILTGLKSFTENVVVDRRKTFEERRAAIKNGEEIVEDEKKSFLDLLLQLFYDDEGARFTNEELRDEVNTFMAAGSDTTADTLSFCFLTMGIHQNIQEKLYKEVVEVIGEDRDVTAADLPNLEYMERFIKETMRLFPPIPVFLRTPSVDIELDDVVLPAHCTVAFNMYHTHRSPKYWKDPLKFDPDRFLPEEESKRHPYAFVPFSGGPRKCLAYKFAMMSMKTVLATVVRKYRVKSEYKSIEEIEVYMTIVLRPMEGFKVSVELRDSNRDS